MDKNDNSCRDISPDALVEILVRLPPNARRRFRQVCRHWRELVDQRTATDMQSRSKVIAAAKGLMSVVDLLKPGSPRRPLWRTQIDMARGNDEISIVGTCNGLVCLCDNLTPGGAITVANPSTGEIQRLPPPAMQSAVFKLNDNRRRGWHQTYGFGYHHRTRQYKVVHVPCHLNPFFQRDLVHVFTLGEASWWRNVHTRTDPTCSLGSSSIMNVDDAMYWLTKKPGKIMSFDLKHERITCTQPLKVQAMPSTYCLAKVHGRLGVVVGDDDFVTVWVLEGERWSRQYILELRQQEKWMMRRELLVPHLVNGDYFLTLTRESWSGFFALCRHMLSETLRSQDDEVQITHKNQGEEVTCFPRVICQMFSYVETKEPVRVFNTVT